MKRGRKVNKHAASPALDGQPNQRGSHAKAYAYDDTDEID